MPLGHGDPQAYYQPPNATSAHAACASAESFGIAPHPKKPPCPTSPIDGRIGHA